MTLTGILLIITVIGIIIYEIVSRRNKKRGEYGGTSSGSEISI